MRCKGAIFDMDGLLFDTERIYYKVWEELAGEWNVTLGDGFLSAVAGTSGKREEEAVETFFHVPDGKPILLECQRRIKARLEGPVPMKSGVVEILNYFRESGVALAVASSNERSQVEKNLREGGIISCFSALVCGGEVKRSKPAPDIFLLAAERLALEGRQCYAFEDSFHGVRAAHEAGCRTVMVPDLMEPTEEILPCCGLVCGSLDEALLAIRNGF